MRDLDAELGDAMQAFVQSLIVLDFDDDPHRLALDRDELLEVMREWTKREVRRDRLGVEIT